MIHLWNALAFLLEWAYVLVFFGILHTFLPARKNWFLRVAGVILLGFPAVMIIYSNDLANLLGALVLFSLYLALFHRGRWVEKAAAVLLFSPTFLAINYLMQDLGAACFGALTGASLVYLETWTASDQTWSCAIHTVCLLLRLLFWLGAWRFLGRYLKQITQSLSLRMWLMVDLLMLPPLVGVFTILYFMPENPLITYPICIVSILSSFGFICLSAYIATTVQTACRAQNLERQQAYYKDRLQDEARVRSIYHDMKNHLLVLEAQTGENAALHQAAQDLQSQLRSYETYQHTGNDYLDMVLRDKARAAQEKGIDFTAAVHFEDGGFLAPLDISTLFGNALDNAIEASEKLPRERRLVTLKTSRVRDMLLIVVENNRLEQELGQRRTSKNDAFLHGFGLENMAKVVEKHDGQMLSKGEGEVFRLKILLPIPS